MREDTFDKKFYLTAYPVVRQELAQGLARTPLEHYKHFGKHRGYLAALGGQRHYPPADTPSVFGGLWPDGSSAAEELSRKLERREIDERQAGLLSRWMRDGYISMENAIPTSLIDAAAHDLDRAYAGEFGELLFECHSIANDRNIRWHPDVQRFPAKALDLHHFSRAMRDIMFAPAVTEFLGLIFGSASLASQSLAFLRGSGQQGHQDSAYVPFTLPRNFAASWIALEDVTIGAGELFYYIGSHRFPDFLYGGKYKCIAEAERLGYPVEHDELSSHVTGLRRRAKEQGIEKSVFAAKKGDVLIWHADLVHGGNPVSEHVTRKSFVTHYCPRQLSPLFSERIATDLYEQDGQLLTSHLYKASQYNGPRSFGSRAREVWPFNKLLNILGSE